MAECLNSLGRFRLRVENEKDASLLGTRLRRALLDDLAGVAAVAVRIDGVAHEYRAVPGAREDALEIAGNVRRVRLRETVAGAGTRHYVGRVMSTSPEVRAGEIAVEGAEVANPDLVIAHLSPGARLGLEIILERGVGFRASNEAPEGFIPLDADFSPVRRVAIAPSADALEVEVETDGSLAAETALIEAMRIVGDVRTCETVPALGQMPAVVSGHPCPEAVGAGQVSGQGCPETTEVGQVSGQGCPDTTGAAWATQDSYGDFLRNGIPRLLDMLFPLVGRALEPDLATETPGRTFTRGRRLELVGHRLRMPDVTPAQCVEDRLTYEARLVLRVRVHRTAEDGIYGSDHPQAREEQEVDMGPIPLMTEEGVLIVNGARRACVMLIDRDLRVRRVGDLLMGELEEIVRRMKPVLEDRVSSVGWLTADLVKLLPLSAAVDDLVKHAHWCQYMDETNPLACITHRMRVAAEEMIGGDVTKVDRMLRPEHFGRLGYLETPEGPNIGLINTLCPQAAIGPDGEVLAPYRRVVNGRVLDELVWLRPEEDESYRIGDAGDAGPDGTMLGGYVSARENGDIKRVPASEVQLMPVSATQALSYSSALIPFLGHDDPNRALFASNLERQAVPLIASEQPLVKTGIEARAALDSCRMVVAKRNGRVVEADSGRIVVQSGRERNIYDLAKFGRTNQASLINQRPLVSPGQEVSEGQVLADTAGTSGGEIAIGKNVLVAYMPFRGLNFEDAICISDELLCEETFTSMSLERAETEIRDSEVWMAPEGARVNPGDVLVQESSGRKRALLVAPPPNPAVVVKRTVRDGRVSFLMANKRRTSIGDKFAGRHGNKGCIARVLPRSEMPFLEDGTPVQMVLNTVGVISRMNVGQILEAHYALVARALGTQFVIPPFATPTTEELRSKLREADLPETGMFTLRDGATGRQFESPVTVGWLYLFKTAHMVDDKIHASSTSVPSVFTHQPTMAQSFNRVGFLEMWALEAYGAGATLQEFMTIKSDDAQGREKAALALLAGEEVDPTGEGASLRLIENALRGLGLDVKEVR